MTDLTLGPVGTHEALPEFGNSVSLVGDPSSLWSDSSDDTYSDMFGNGFGNPWGHPYAEVPGLTLTAEQAAGVTEVVVRWRIKLTPGANEPLDPTVLPYIDVVPGEEGTNSPSDETLGSFDWWDEAGDWTVMIVSQDWQWRQTKMIPGFAWSSLQEFLTDPRPKYVTFNINSSWQDEHFQIAEVEVLVDGLNVAVPYRRIGQRSDGLAGGARRIHPRPTSIQGSNRRGGGIV